MMEFLTNIDVLKIPEAMLPYLSPVWLVSIALLPFIFVISILTEQSKIVKGDFPQYNTVIYSTLLVILGMFLYRYIFIKIVALCEGISMSIINIGDWAAFTTVVKNTQTSTGFIQVMRMNFVSILHGFSTILLLVVEVIFMIVRYVFLSVLYVVGPVSFVFAIYGPTKSLIKAWFLSVFQVSFWIIVFRIMQAVLLSFNLGSYISAASGKGENVFITIAASIGFVFMAVLTPAFTSKLFSGQSIGLLGSTFVAGATLIVTKFAGATFRGATGGKISPEALGESTKSVAVGTVKGTVAAVRTFVKTGDIKESIKIGWQTARGKIPRKEPEPPMADRKR
ncbi:MAG: hypothetical protein QME68_00145 [Elusimicrobiota bacterium]|nr:hypothetical protein [Elusimicrobiota bacterium]